MKKLWHQRLRWSMALAGGAGLLAVSGAAAASGPVISPHSSRVEVKGASPGSHLLGLEWGTGEQGPSINWVNYGSHIVANADGQATIPVSKARYGRYVPAHKGQLPPGEELSVYAGNKYLGGAGGSGPSSAVAVSGTPSMKSSDPPSSGGNGGNGGGGGGPTPPGPGSKPDPDDRGALTLTTLKNGLVQATWDWNHFKNQIHQGDVIFLLGVQGTHADAANAPIETFAWGQVTGQDVQSHTFSLTFQPPAGWPDVHEAFEMHTVSDHHESLPYAQLPEVPLAGALPLVLLAPMGYLAVRRRMVREQ